MDKAAKEANTQELRALAQGFGFDLFGVADVTSLRADFLLEPETRDRFGLGRVAWQALERRRPRRYPRPPHFDLLPPLPADELLPRPRGPRPRRPHPEAGVRSLAIAASQIIDWENQRAHVSHKHVGRAAGLGWFGRNNLLVNPELGAHFRLVTVLTDMPLEAGAPLDRDCRACRACAKACPAGAIKDTREAFDHKACYETLKDFRKKGYTTQFICGICVRDCRGPK